MCPYIAVNTTPSVCSRNVAFPSWQDDRVFLQQSYSTNTPKLTLDFCHCRFTFSDEFKRLVYQTSYVRNVLRDPLLLTDTLTPPIRRTLGMYKNKCGNTGNTSWKLHDYFSNKPSIRNNRENPANVAYCYTLHSPVVSNNELVRRFAKGH